VFLNRTLREAQSIIEYAVLLAVVLSAILLLQTIVKRGFSGGLREASDRMGEQYSPTNTTMRTRRTMDGDQFINEEVNTRVAADGQPGMDTFLPMVPAFGYTPKYVGDLGAYNYTERLDQKHTYIQEEKTDSASKELFRWDEIDAAGKTWPDFPDPFTIP